MNIFSEIADQYQIADQAFAAIEQIAFTQNDDRTFDRAAEQRRRNDQAYFLYLFTRFEYEVNKGVASLIASRLALGATWSDQRIWDAWTRNEIKDIPFLSRVEVLLDKSKGEYASIKKLYKSRNEISHGGILEGQFLIAVVAQQLDGFVSTFVTS